MSPLGGYVALVPISVVCPYLKSIRSKAQLYNRALDLTDFKYELTTPNTTVGEILLRITALLVYVIAQSFSLFCTF